MRIVQEFHVGSRTGGHTLIIPDGAEFLGIQDHCGDIYITAIVETENSHAAVHVFVACPGDQIPPVVRKSTWLGACESGVHVFAEQAGVAKAEG